MKLSKDSEEMVPPELFQKERNLNRVKGNKVYILGHFDDTISEIVIPALMDEINHLKMTASPELEFFIDSPGGETYKLFSLLYCIDVARSYGIKIITNVMGVAHSCGSMLAIYGDVRYMGKYSNHLIHYGFGESLSATPTQIERNSQMLQNHFKKLEKIYQERTKLDIKTIRALMKDDHCYMEANECLKNGLCDFIVG